jgi:choice-of-anchor B domain-containing protein
LSLTLATVLSAIALATARDPRVRNNEQQGFKLVQDKVHMGPEMESMRALKEKEWMLLANATDYTVYNNAALNSGKTPCINGAASGYGCHNIDMYGYLPHFPDLRNVWGNDIWGWTSDDGREIALVGQGNGTSFVEVLQDGSLRNLGYLPTQTVFSIWRDIKVIDGYAYIGSEAFGHGMQIFDIRKVLNNSKPVAYTVDDLTAHFDGFGSSHNIVANEETHIVYAVGANTCRGGLVAVDVSDPSDPLALGCFEDDGYTHDAQCLVYRGPDTQYYGKPLCFGFNEDTLTITDHSDESDIRMISRSTYPKSAYSHQGWLASDNHDIILLDDELDEVTDTTGTGGRATTYFWNITNLAEPILYDEYVHTAVAIDHNLYTKDGFAYHANYGSGLRVIDIRSMTGGREATIAAGPGKVTTAAYFDIWPGDDELRFMGAWSVYPYFKSGFIVVNGIGNGVFSLKRTDI